MTAAKRINKKEKSNNHQVVKQTQPDLKLVNNVNDAEGTKASAFVIQDGTVYIPAHQAQLLQQAAEYTQTLASEVSRHPEGDYHLLGVDRSGGVTHQMDGVINRTESGAVVMPHFGGLSSGADSGTVDEEIIAALYPGRM